MKLLNSFSLQMVGHLSMGCVLFREISIEKAKENLSCGIESYIGHVDTARIVSSLIGKEVPFNRQFATLDHGESAIVCQVIGGRLPEGCMELPAGVEIKFYRVSV